MHCSHPSAFPAIFAVASLVVLIGCADEAPQSATGTEALTKQASEPLREGMAVTGMDLWMWDFHPTHGQERKPTFKVHAKEANLSETDNVWNIRGAEAVIYSEESDLIIEAALGRFDEGNNLVKLTDGVKAHNENMTMNLKDLEWDNEAGVARSDKTLTVTSGGSRVEAEGIVLTPASNAFVLSRFTAYVEFPKGKS